MSGMMPLKFLILAPADYRLFDYRRLLAVRIAKFDSTERIASLRGSGYFHFGFEWNGLDQSSRTRMGKHCLNFPDISDSLSFGVNRFGIRAPFSYLIEKTKALLEGRALQRTPFESDQRLISPWYSRVADVFILWRENI
jgi:hypothetical protein